jgi:hypothetical protein
MRGDLAGSSGFFLFLFLFFNVRRRFFRAAFFSLGSSRYGKIYKSTPIPTGFARDAHQRWTASSQAGHCAGPREAVSTPHSSLPPSDVPRTNGGGLVGLGPIGQLGKRGLSACAPGDGPGAQVADNGAECADQKNGPVSILLSPTRRFGAESGLRGSPFEATKLIFFSLVFLFYLTAIHRTNLAARDLVALDPRT